MAERPPWKLNLEGVELWGLLQLSFQRFLVEGREFSRDVPVSLGAHRLGIDPESRLVLGQYPGEACWVGVRPARGGVVRLRWRVRTPEGDLLEESPDCLCPPLRRIAGVSASFRGAGWFTRLPESPAAPAIGSVEFIHPARESANVAVHLVTIAEFTLRAGSPPPPPPNPSHGYQGWRLP